MMWNGNRVSTTPSMRLNVKRPRMTHSNDIFGCHVCNTHTDGHISSNGQIISHIFASNKQQGDNDNQRNHTGTQNPEKFQRFVCFVVKKKTQNSKLTTTLYHLFFFLFSSPIFYRHLDIPLECCHSGQANINHFYGFRF